MLLQVPKVAAPTLPGASVDATKPPPDAAPKAKIDLFKVPLSKPLKTHAGMVSVLSLREPIADDYIEIGRVPTSVRGMSTETQELMMDHKCMGLWAVRLAQIDGVLLGMLPAKDWITLCGHVNAILVQAGIDDVGN